MIRILRVSLAVLFITKAGWCGTQACAHRGDMKCAPENTLPAIESAVKKGAHMIEFDVQLSKDGALVLMHDATVDRTTDGTGKVTELTYPEIRKLDAGSWFGTQFKGVYVPMLPEVLNQIPHAIWCNIHIKGTPFLGRVTALVLKEMGRLDHCFLACDTEQAAEARAAVPHIRICNMSRQENDRAAYIAATIEQKCQYIQLPKKQGLDNLKADVDQLHAHGVIVNFFGASEDPLIRTLVESGIDYILTDDLDLCLKVLSEYGTAPLPRQTPADPSEKAPEIVTVSMPQTPISQPSEVIPHALSPI